MALTDLDAKEQRVILECLRAAASGPFFPDWEFRTLIGVKRDDVQAIVDAWPSISDTDENVSLAINNSMNNLLGYPHGREKDWPRYISVAPTEVRRIFDKWRGYRSRRRLTARLVSDACAAALRAVFSAPQRER